MKRHRSLAAFAVAVLASVPAFASVPLECSTPALPAAADPADDWNLGPDSTGIPDPQENVCFFICEPWFQTSVYWGIGPDCTSSRNNLSSQVGAEASSTGPGLCNDAGAAFGYCGWNLVITGACHWDWNHLAYVTDGYGNIKCKDYC